MWPTLRVARAWRQGVSSVDNVIDEVRGAPGAFVDRSNGLDERVPPRRWRGGL
jgi:hypothetical protein